MQLHNIRSNSGGYTTWGCMWKKGECKDTFFCCRNEQGREVPMQSRITAYWPDGSVKWTAHTADAAMLGKNIVVELSEQKTQAVVKQPLSIEENENSILIHKGKIT